MALETKDINNAADMQRYVEGCLNDLMEGLSTKDETMKYLHDYTLRVINLTAECVGYKPETSDEALPMSRVVKRYGLEYDTLDEVTELILLGCKLRDEGLEENDADRYYELKDWFQDSFM